MQGIEGLRLILWGLFKKVAIADTLAIHVDMILKIIRYLMVVCYL